MTILQLEYFVAVVDHGSFSAAARHCFISQPSLSQHIQSLEKELGVVLLDRSSKPIVPTEAGMPILEQARNTIESFLAVKEKVNEWQTEAPGKLRLGTIPSLSPYILPRFIPEFIRRCPDTELEIRDMFQGDIADALNRNLLDVAIIVGGEPLPNIRETTLFIDNIYAYVSPQHELYQREVICHNDLDLGRMLTIHEGVWMREKRDAVSEARRNAKALYSFMNNSPETMMNMADAGAGITMIPGMAIDYIPAEKRSRIKVFNEHDARRTITMAVARTYMRRKIIDAVRDSCMVVAEQYALADLLRR